MVPPALCKIRQLEFKSVLQELKANAANLKENRFTVTR